MVRQWQELFWDSKYSSVDLEASPDFVKLADAYGAYGRRITDPSEMKSALEEAMAITDRPCVLDFRIVKEANVYPMIPSGQTIKQMVAPRPEGAPPLDEEIDAQYLENGELAVTPETLVANPAPVSRGGMVCDPEAEPLVVRQKSE